MTHQVSLVAESADRIIRLVDGHIDDGPEPEGCSDEPKPDLGGSEADSEDTTLETPPTLKKDNNAEDDTDFGKSLLDVDKTKVSQQGKLVMTEERAHGRVSKQHLLTWLGYMGGESSSRSSIPISQNTEA